jgi:hypothetical protein
MRRKDRDREREREREENTNRHGRCTAGRLLLRINGSLSRPVFPSSSCPRSCPNSNFPSFAPRPCGVQVVSASKYCQ